MLERLLKLAEIMAAEGDVEGLKSLDRRLAGYIRRKAHFVPENNGNVPNPLRKNMDYAEWENSPYYSSVSEFMKKFPGGIKDWVEWRKNNREDRYKKWDINKRKAYVLHILKKGELDYDDLSGEYEPTSEERELAEMPATSEEREKAFELLLKNIEMIKEMAGLSDNEVKKWLGKHYGQKGMAADDWDPEEDPEGDLEEYYKEQNTFSYVGESVPKPDLNRWKSEWRAERYVKDLRPFIIKEWRVIENDEGTHYLLQALHVVPESVHGWQPKGSEAQYSWYTIDKKPTKYSVPEHYDTELEDIKFTDDPKDTQITLKQLLDRIKDPATKFDLLQALVNKEILSYKRPQASGKEEDEYLAQLWNLESQINKIKNKVGVLEDIKFDADDEVELYVGPIEKDTIKNKNYRKVIFTGKFGQLVLMNIKPDEEIGEEIHNDTDQFFRIEAGKGKFILNDKKKTVKDGDAVYVPAGTKHNVINDSNEPLKLYTIYSPPHHPKGTVEKIKVEKESEEMNAYDLNVINTRDSKMLDRLENIKQQVANLEKFDFADWLNRIVDKNKREEYENKLNQLKKQIENIDKLLYQRKKAHYVPEGKDNTNSFEKEPHMYADMDKYNSISEYLEKYHAGQDAKDAAFDAAKDFVRYWRLLLKRNKDVKDGRKRVATRLAALESELVI